MISTRTMTRSAKLNRSGGLPHRLMAGFVVGAGLAASLMSPANAEASPLTCEHRSAAHITEHGGRLEDDRYHLARGEMPNCDDSEPAQSSRDDDKPSEDNNKNNDDDKSRYCKKRWYC